MSYKTVDSLMRHLRDSGIMISGSAQKRQLINTGYFHGYKGYRFFSDTQSRHQIPFSSYSEVYATIKYDSELKSLFYGKIMIIETAVKNIAMECILRKSRSESIQAMLTNSVSGANNSPKNFTNDQKRKAQQKKLDLQNSIQRNLARAYKNKDPKITHFYDKYADVPIWALFEITMLGDFGNILSCLTYEVREDISKKIGLNLSSDTNRELVYEYIYLLKDLRNAIAHNSAIFDTRFKKAKPSRPMTACLINEIHLPYVNFNSIGDYIVLVSYFLKILHVSKREIKSFISEYEKITSDYINSVSKSNVNVVKAVIKKDWKKRMTKLKNYI